MNCFSGLIIVAFLALSSAERCVKPCTKELRPVCGSDGEHFKIFSNKCMLENEHCKDGRMWIQTRMDSCKMDFGFEELDDCEVPCSKELRLVCGTSEGQFKLFPNPCIMGNQHCKDGRQWIQTRMDKCIKTTSDCEVPCSKELRLVCGTSEGQFKLFPNPCIMGNQHCKDGRQWIQTRMDKCIKTTSDCEVACTREYKPVCATDGKQFKIFANPCLMRNAHCVDGKNWIQTHMDVCRAHIKPNIAETSDCTKICPAIYRPVCGFDGESYKVFPNKCVMEVDSCQFNKDWLMVSMDKCGSF